VFGDLYAQDKFGGISKNQYDCQRRLLLNQFKNNIGPFERWLFGNKTSHEAIRIARGGGIPATKNITDQAARLKRLATYGKHGGYVPSTSIGLAAGYAITLFLVSNPVGWGTALVLAAGSAAFSFGSGYLAKKAYTALGSEVDFVSGAGVDSICR
jgi:hypothetical protein